jgi:hypothetical protein
MAPWSARMSRRPRRTIVFHMLNQLHTAADLAADHRRTLQAEADAYRLARTARLGAPAAADRPARRRWFGVLRPAPRRAAGSA